MPQKHSDECIIRSFDPYLKGELFDPSLIYYGFNSSKCLTSRIKAIVDASKNNSVLHIGCADHPPLIEAKISSNTWLHKLLTDNSRYCLGIDLSEEGLDKCRDLGYHNVELVDILDPNSSIPLPSNGIYDFAILGEILEHVPDPCLFLGKLRSKLLEKCKKLLITVPNSVYYKNFIYALSCKECINSDHRYYFSPNTISKILCDAGYHDISIKFVSGRVPRFNIPKNFFSSRFPMLRETLVVTATL